MDERGRIGGKRRQGSGWCGSGGRAERDGRPEHEERGGRGPIAEAGPPSCGGRRPIMRGDGSRRAVRKCSVGAFGVSAAVSHPAAMLGDVRDWTEGEMLGLDFETTGVDRFTDVPVSYALVPVRGRRRRAQLVGADRPRPGDPAGRDRGARDLDRAGSGRGHAARRGDRRWSPTPSSRPAGGAYRWSG